MAEQAKNEILNREELFERIKSSLESIDPAEVILFGSFAREEQKYDSDLDLIVILKKGGYSKNYGELIKNRIEVSRLLNEIKKEIPIDLFVFTEDEWTSLRQSGASFFKEIQQSSLRIL